jgi:hypothetical protein
MLPSVTLNGRPNQQAMVFACRALTALEEGDEYSSKQLANSVGARQHYWLQNRATHPIDWSMFRDNNTLWITCYGTENWSQVLGFLSTTLPVYDPNFGAFVLDWARTQAVQVFERVQVELNGSVPSNIVVTGHSLGGAVANVLSRYISNAVSLRRQNTMAERIVMSHAFMPFAAVGLGLRRYSEQRAEYLERQQTTGPPVDVITFGEPRSVGPGAEYNPRIHWRIVGSQTQDYGNEILSAYSRVDPVTLLPPNAAVVPGPGILTGIPGISLLSAKVGLGITPKHYGIPVYLTATGNVIGDPLNKPIRVAGEIGIGLAALIRSANLRLHFLWATYLPGSIALGLNPEVQQRIRVPMEENIRLLQERIAELNLAYQEASTREARIAIRSRISQLQGYIDEMRRNAANPNQPNFNAVPGAGLSEYQQLVQRVDTLLRLVSILEAENAELRRQAGLEVPDYNGVPISQRLGLETALAIASLPIPSTPSTEIIPGQQGIPSQVSPVRGYEELQGELYPQDYLPVPFNGQNSIPVSPGQIYADSLTQTGAFNPNQLGSVQYSQRQHIPLFNQPSSVQSLPPMNGSTQDLVPTPSTNQQVQPSGRGRRTRIQPNETP